MSSLRLRTVLNTTRGKHPLITALTHTLYADLHLRLGLLWHQAAILVGEAWRGQGSRELQVQLSTDEH